ncbi:MAG: hypothetical protein ABIF71_11635 [Planctomycetota bacterium]
MIRGLFGYKEVSKNVQNQIILPAEFREILTVQSAETRFYIYMEEGRSLLFSTLDELLRDMGGVNAALMQTMDRNSFGMFSRNVVIVGMGDDGRITLTRDMMQAAGMRPTEKKVICCGADNKIEIWGAERYREQIENKRVEYTAVRQMFEKEVFKLRPRPVTESSGADPAGDIGKA